MPNSEQPLGYRFGSFTLDLEWGGLITADGKEMPLRPKSFALLRLLVENARRILSRDEIMMVLWPNLYVTENNVTQCIRDVRRALGPEACELLQTISRRGYRFTSHVVEIPRRNPPVLNAAIEQQLGNPFTPARTPEYYDDDLLL